jgi:DNA-binding NarL/FixJ family response regulator
MAIPRRPRILLADDHHLFRDAMRKMLEPSCEVVGAVGDGRGLLAMAQQLHPDIVLLDIAMPLLTWLNAGRQLKQLLPRIHLIYLTMLEDQDLMNEALRLGASGFLLKASEEAELWEAIHSALQGKVFVTPLAGTAIPETGTPLPHRREHAVALTPRQRQVLQLLAEGHSMKEVGSILNVAARTIAFHKYRMMEELEIKSSAELVRYAITEGLVSASSYV